ncbi:hypothetical protein DMN77_11020 [Paenibacillus sp. 79R4]|uniref:leucine-rich repeat protein n=1 Tax=Paenibacillus sp. 79R4 TaxID=2212847 RepID=UPI0015BDCB1E|nr:leucine-rich repeat protein [Paenibacillus sp. 79R4]NWL88119.1 hypothetical protein [Paenibacillus sp. 79R4]
MARLVQFGLLSAVAFCAFFLAGLHAHAAVSGDFEYMDNADGTVTITYYFDPVKYDNHLVVPAQLDGKTVTAIGDQAFRYAFIFGLTLPDTIKSIGKEAFELTRVLKNVKLPSGLVSIGDYAFNYNQIEQITLPDSLEHIGFSAFSYNKLKSVSLPSGLKTMDQFAFWHNEITSVSFPESMTKIPNHTFVENKITSATIPKNVTEIGSHAFSANSLTNIKILSAATQLARDSIAENKSQLTVYGHSGSPAQKFALNNGFLFEQLKMQVTYDGNNHTDGDVPVDDKSYVRLDEATVLGNTGLLERPGYRFDGWNTAPDGSGKDYAVNSKIRIEEEDVILFAKWVRDAKTPVITDAVTAENRQSTSGLVITPDPEDSGNVKYYKISGIVGGTLYKHDGTTQIANGDYITVAEGGAGLRFTPEAHANSVAGDTFSFQVQAAPKADGTLLSNPVTASIHVTEVNDAPVAADDTLPKVMKGAGKIIIEFADLLLNDSAGPANESFQSLTIIDVGNAVGGTVEIINGHIEFDLEPTFVGVAKFTYTVLDDGKTDGADDFKTASAEVSFEVGSRTSVPLAHPAGGAVASGTKVTLTSTTAGAVIYYTTDGTTPTSASTLYTGPIEITDAITLKAIAVKPGLIDSEVMTEQYTLAPIAPITLTATAGDGLVKLNWNAVAATSSVTYSVYKVAGSAAASDPNEWVPVQTDIMATNFTVTGLTNGTSYAFAVKAFAAGNVIDFSNVATATPQASGGNGGENGGSGNNGGSVGSGGNDGKNVAPPAHVTSTNGSIDLPAASSGKVSLDGEIFIHIPDRAAEQELRITIEKLVDTSDLFTERETILSRVYEVSKNLSGSFKEPVTLSIKFDSAKVGSNQKVAIFYYDEDKKTWIEVGGTVDGEWITTEIDHFTKFAVLELAANKDDNGETPKQPSPSFTDITGHWGESFIVRAVAQELVSGYPNGTFQPNIPVTRAEFTVMLAAALKLDGTDTALPFKDQDKIGAWAKQAVALAVQTGIVSGYEDGSFRPEAQITRTEMAYMIAKALDLSLEDDVETGFADNKDIPKWAKGTVEAIRELGIVSGRGGNKFVPNNTATRAEAVVMLLRMLVYKDNQ